MVGGRVLPSVVDQGEVFDAGRELPVAAGQFVQQPGELGDVGTVAGVGVRQQRDRAVAGDDQTQPDQPQVHPFLFRFAALGDRGLVVAGVDVGGEVRHVQDQPGQVQGVLGDEPPAELGLDGA